MKLIKKLIKDDHGLYPYVDVKFIKDWFKLEPYCYTDYGYDESSFESYIPDASILLIRRGETMSLKMADDECNDYFIGWLNQMIEDDYIEVLNPEVFEWEETNG